jgi:ATP-dependent Clp protease protease subunit
MMAIYDTMQFVSSDIRTVCLGQAGSAAAILLAAGTPGKRLMLCHARVVIQQPSMEPVVGQAADLQILAAEMLRVRVAMEDILAVHTRRGREQIRTDLARDTILTSAEALNQSSRNPVRSHRPRCDKQCATKCAAITP